MNLAIQNELKKKLSVTIDSDIESKLHKIQSRYIDNTGKNCNLSMLINLVLATGLVGSKRLTRDDWSQIKGVLDGDKVSFDNKAAKDFVGRLSS